MTMSGAGVAWGGVERTLVTNIRSRKLRAVLAWGDQNMGDLGWEGVEGERLFTLLTQCYVGKHPSHVNHVLNNQVSTHTVSFDHPYEKKGL